MRVQYHRKAARWLVAAGIDNLAFATQLFLLKVFSSAAFSAASISQIYVMITCRRISAKPSPSVQSVVT